jgi:hypothetical protein
VNDDGPNATPARPGPNWLQRSVPPRHEKVWVRIRGTWRKGLVRCWVREDHGWECLIEDEAFDGSPWQGRYVYDSRTILPAYGDEPPHAP